VAYLDDRAMGASSDPETLDTAVPDGIDGNGALLGNELDAVAEQTRALVRERPFVALAGAVLAGFLVARILSRR
jgi:ElaB/YqjD/DUF883 family membrane-anchored ribosome-binding protein